MATTQMFGLVGFIAIVAASFGLGGCATTGVTGRVVLWDSPKAAVAVAGRGTVVGEGADLRCNADSRAEVCKVDSDGLNTPALVPQAAPGWRFDHWEIARGQSDLAKMAHVAEDARPDVYKAVFVPAEKQTAKSEGNAR